MRTVANVGWDSNPNDWDLLVSGQPTDQEVEKIVKGYPENSRIKITYTDGSNRDVLLYSLKEKIDWEEEKIVGIFIKKKKEDAKAKIH